MHANSDAQYSLVCSESVSSPFNQPRITHRCSRFCSNDRTAFAGLDDGSMNVWYPTLPITSANRHTVLPFKHTFVSNGVCARNDAKSFGFACRIAESRMPCRWQAFEHVPDADAMPKHAHEPRVLRQFVWPVARRAPPQTIAGAV